MEQFGGFCGKHFPYANEGEALRRTTQKHNANPSELQEIKKGLSQYMSSRKLAGTGAPDGRSGRRISASNPCPAEK
jgi:hypothetical protein